MWYWAASIGGPPSTHAIAAAIGTPAAGAEVDVVVAGEPDGDVVVGVAERDGVIGVSWVCVAWPPVDPEQPPTSNDAASSTDIRIPTG